MLKRVFDVLFSLIGLVLYAPLFLLIAVLIKLDSEGPVSYPSLRVGRFGKTFRAFKLRTMVADAEKIGPTSTAKDDPRITRVGALLRKYKLDELPQLLNVLRGDMSLVGPRPQVPWAVNLYSDQERVLLTVRPGMTDYGSIKFSNEGEILRGSVDPDRDYLQKIAPEKIKLGLWYVRNQSLRVDLRILVDTLRVLMGANREKILSALEAPSSPVESPCPHGNL